MVTNKSVLQQRTYKTLKEKWVGRRELVTAGGRSLCLWILALKGSVVGVVEIGIVMFGRRNVETGNERRAGSSRTCEPGRSPAGLHSKSGG